MAINVSVETVSARTLAAVRRKVRIEQIGAAWRPALDLVWEFLSQHPGLRGDGHNVFLYHHPANMQSPMDVDFGVQVMRSFPQEKYLPLKRRPARSQPRCTSVRTSGWAKPMAQSTPGRPLTIWRSRASPGRSMATGRTIQRSWKLASNIFWPEWRLASPPRAKAVLRIRGPGPRVGVNISINLA